MATIHLMVGLPGSGKTTQAIRLTETCRALRLTPDEWHYHLFGNDFYNDPEKDIPHNERHTRIEALMWNTAQRVLRLGVDVILDFGCWAKEERDEMRMKAHAIGADFKIHYMNCPKETIWERLQARNKRVGSGAPFHISRESFEAWYAAFEPPAEEELL